MALSSLHPLVQLLLAILCGFGLYLSGSMAATFWRHDVDQRQRTVWWCRAFAVVCACAAVGFGLCAALYLVGGVVAPGAMLYQQLVL